jgi:acetyl esterase/lipase
VKSRQGARRGPRALAAAAVLAAAFALILTGCSTSGSAPSTTGPSPSATAAAASAGAGGMPGVGTDTGSVKRKYLDVPYASKSSAQQLDVYLPNSGTGPFPVILSIHGGAFAMGDKADGQLAPMLAGLDRGYAVVSANYRLSGEATFPAAIDDVKAAVRFLRANAAKYDLDTDRIVAWGGSAGGNLAALLGTSGAVAALSDPSLGNASQSDKVQAVIDWFGPIAFLQMDPEFRASRAGLANHDEASSPESQYLGAALPTVPGKVRAANPTTYISTDDPPFLIEHGEMDANVPVQQSQRFAKALSKVLGADKVTLKIIPGAGHMDPAFDTPANLKLVFDWLDKRFNK